MTESLRLNLSPSSKPARATALGHVRVEPRNFDEQGVGLPDARVNDVMLFNILDSENPVGPRKEARRILSAGRKGSAIPWRADIDCHEARRYESAQSSNSAASGGLAFVRE